MVARSASRHFITVRAAPAASFSRLNPNRPGPEISFSERQHPAGPLPIEF
jgi:hypothetical protein